MSSKGGKGKKGSKKKRQQRTKKVDFRSKKWYKVQAPKSFDYKEIGEVIGLENNIIGRTIDCLYFDFTGDYNDINLKLDFKINEINTNNQTCKSIFKGHSFTNDYVRSIVGRGSSKIQLINNFTTKDGFIYRVTANCITIRRARSSQQVLIRKIMRDIMREFAKALNHEKFVLGMINGEFANQITRVAKTVYPLSASSIIKSHLITIPEGGEDKEIPDEEFDIVEVDVKRSRKSDIRRTERINVKKLDRYSKRAESKEEKEKEADVEEEEEEVEEEEE